MPEEKIKVVLSILDFIHYPFIPVPFKDDFTVFPYVVLKDGIYPIYENYVNRFACQVFQFSHKPQLVVKIGDKI